MSKACLVDGELLDRLKTMPSERFDALLTDPPYGLEFMGRDWDKVVPGVEVWREVMRVLKPGAFGLVFGGTRTFHRLAVALEDAGLELRDTLMWVYGQGFPKSQDISKAIDKAVGAERKVTGTARGHVDSGGVHDDDNYVWKVVYERMDEPASPEAERWHGWGTALKPAWEPILLVRKPTKLTNAQTALEHGSGALNIDGTRISTKNDLNGGAYVGEKNKRGGIYGKLDYDLGEYQQPEGRFPANLIHDGSEEVVAEFPTTRAGVAVRHRSGGNTFGGDNPKPPMSDLGYGDPGSAARFFYTAKASRSERDAGLESFPELSGGEATRRVDGSAGVNHPRAGAGRTGGGRNAHPTVKPIALTEYLAKLLLPPPGDTRRLFVPFAGSGSEIIGALQAGWEWAIGVELETAYHDIAQQRIEHRGFVVDRRLT